MEINDVIKSISLEEVKSHISQMKYALIYQISEVIFDRIEQIVEINWEECLEGYFFDENTQIHVYSTEDGLQAVFFAEPEDVEYIDKDYKLSNKYRNVGEKIRKREYFDYDEDGQVYVAYTRLFDVK